MAEWIWASFLTIILRILFPCWWNIADVNHLSWPRLQTTPKICVFRLQAQLSLIYQGKFLLTFKHFFQTPPGNNNFCIISWGSHEPIYICCLNKILSVATTSDLTFVQGIREPSSYPLVMPSGVDGGSQSRDAPARFVWLTLGCPFQNIHGRQ